jgi:hypothetical protein
LTRRETGPALNQPPPPWELTNKTIENAVMEPPSATRAHARSQMMRLREHAPPYSIDWEIGRGGLEPAENMLDPFDRIRRN